jgi:hypothetical protein
LSLKIKRKRELVRPKYILVDNIKLDHRGVEHEASDWIYVAESRLQPWDLLNTVKNQKVLHIKVWNTLSKYVPVSFSKRTVFLS